MISNSYQKTVGIMISPKGAAPPFTGHRFFAHLCELGARWGLLVYVFSPIHLDVSTAAVQGYKYQASRWFNDTFPLPDLIYDRAFFNNPTEYRLHLDAIHKLQNLKRTPYLGQILQGKWIVHQILRKHPALALHLPFTELLRTPAQFIKSLNEHRTILLKPVTGSQGKGVLIVTKTVENEISVQGRSMLNQPIAKCFATPISMYTWFRSFAGRRGYLLQQYLSLHTDQGNAYDVRVLMQKNKRGLWTQTGMAARIGSSASITSNLHGGGQGAFAYPLLVKQFGAVRAKAILTVINQLSILIPPHLEQHFGRFSELGIDIGIDQSGAVWIIEVNSKPGRAVAQWFTQPNAIEAAMSKPIQYAHHLLHESANLGTILGG